MSTSNHARLFRWLDRAFWVIWAAFPGLVYLIVDGILTQPEQLAEISDEACGAAMPHVLNFTATGQVLFWSVLGVEIGFYALLLLLSHRIIRACARGRIFVDDVTAALRSMGLLIALWPVVEMVLSNAAVAALASLGDFKRFQPYLAFDLPVFGVGLLLLAVSLAMAQAVRMARESELTI